MKIIKAIVKVALATITLESSGLAMTCPDGVQEIVEDYQVISEGNSAGMRLEVRDVECTNGSTIMQMNVLAVNQGIPSPFALNYLDDQGLPRYVVQTWTPRVGIVDVPSKAAEALRAGRPWTVIMEVLTGEFGGWNKPLFQFQVHKR